MRAFLRLTLTVLRLYVRDPLTVALSLALIVFMMVLFGVVMGEEPFDVELPLAVVDRAQNDASQALIARLEDDDWLVARQVADEAEAVELIRRAQVIGALVLSPALASPAGGGEGSGLRLIRDDDTSKWIDLGIDHLRDLLAADGGGEAPWETHVEPVAVVKNRYIDFIFPGVLAMAIMQACLASGLVLLEARERGVLRRLQLTPLPSASILGSFLAGRFLVVALHILVLVLVATLGFRAHILAAPWELVVLVVLGTLSFMAIGVMVVLVAPSFESANLIVQMCSLPMSFLCGVFFKVEAMPKVLQWLAQALPLTYLVDLIRGTVTLGVPLAAYPRQLAALAAWLAAAVVVCLVAYHRLDREAIR